MCAVVKLSSGGGQVQFVDDNGWVFVTSKRLLLDLLGGRSSAGFVELSLLPVPVSAGRWRPSPVVDPSAGWLLVPRAEAVSRGLVPSLLAPVVRHRVADDLLSVSSRRELASERVLGDVNDW